MGARARAKARARAASEVAARVVDKCAASSNAESAATATIAASFTNSRRDEFLGKTAAVKAATAPLVARGGVSADSQRPVVASCSQLPLAACNLQPSTAATGTGAAKMLRLLVSNLSSHWHIGPR